MSLAAARFAASVSRLQRHFAGPVSKVEIRGTAGKLTNPLTGAAVTALAVNGTTALNATVINLDAASVRGTLGLGWQFKIAGEATTYETTAAVNAVTNAFASVPITPALAAEAANDAVVTITRFYNALTYRAMRREFRQEVVDGEAIKLGDWMLIVPLVGAAQPELDPVKDSVVYDGKTLTVVRKMPFAPGLDEAAWRLHVRGAA